MEDFKDQKLDFQCSKSISLTYKKVFNLQNLHMTQPNNKIAAQLPKMNVWSSGKNCKEIAIKRNGQFLLWTIQIWGYY